MADLIPRSDPRFNDWQNNFFEIVEAGQEQWKISEDALSRLSQLRTQWNSAYDAADNSRDRTKASVTAKNEARAAYVKELRLFIKSNLAFNEEISDFDRERMGITVHSGKHTMHPVPSTAPVAEVDFSVHLRHSIRFRDSHSAGRGKPAGVYGCEIWTKVGGQPPVEEQEMTYLGTDTRSAYTVVFHGGQQGQTAYYWLRWVNTRGERGPWSAPVSAVIA